MNLENHEHEQALLGCVLRDNRVVDDCKVVMAMFDNRLCREAFRIIESCRSRGAVANLREVALMMPQDAGWVARLTDNISAANARYYANSLRDLARRRGLARLARDLADKATTDDLPDLFSWLDQSIAGISEIRESGYRPIAEHLDRAIDEIRAAWETRGALQGVDTGFPGLNDRTNGWQKGNFIVIGARPGTGKTAIALNMMGAALRKGGRRAGFFSAEMSGASIMRRMIADWGAVEHKRLQSGLMGRDDMDRIGQAARDLLTMGDRLMLNDEPCIDLADLVSDARKMKRRGGVDIVFVDYLSLVGNERRDIPRHEQVAGISRGMKALARELDIPVVVLSQLTREAQDGRPQLNQIRDSGAVEQDADIVVLLHNLGPLDERSQRVNLIIAKNRNGSVGDVPLLFQPALMRFGEAVEKWDAKA